MIFLAGADLFKYNLADAIDQAEMGEAGGGQVLGQGKLGAEGSVDGEEAEGYGAGYVAAVGVDFGVEVFEGAGAVCGWVSSLVLLRWREYWGHSGRPSSQSESHESNV